LFAWVWDRPPIYSLNQAGAKTPLRPKADIGEASAALITALDPNFPMLVDSQPTREGAKCHQALL
jgi:hypothetical protein